MELADICETMDAIEKWTYEDLCFYTAFALCEGKKKSENFVTDVSSVFAMLAQIHFASGETDECVH